MFTNLPAEQMPQASRLLPFHGLLNPLEDHGTAQYIIDILHRQLEIRFQGASLEDANPLRAHALHFFEEDFLQLCLFVMLQVLPVVIVEHQFVAVIVLILDHEIRLDR